MAIVVLEELHQRVVLSYGQGGLLFRLACQLYAVTATPPRVQEVADSGLLALFVTHLVMHALVGDDWFGCLFLTEYQLVILRLE